MGVWCKARARCYVAGCERVCSRDARHDTTRPASTLASRHMCHASRFRRGTQSRPTEPNRTEHHTDICGYVVYFELRIYFNIYIYAWDTFVYMLRCRRLASWRCTGHSLQRRRIAAPKRMSRKPRYITTLALYTNSIPNSSRNIKSTKQSSFQVFGRWHSNLLAIEVYTVIRRYLHLILYKH